MAESIERKSKPPLRSAPSLSRVSDELRRTQVVVVEDHPDTRRALCDTLQACGLGTLATADGNEALLHLRQATRPVVVLLDLYMPGLNGFELYQQMQTDPSLASIPVIVVTAAPPQQRIGLNVAGTIRKPIDIDELLMVLEKVSAKKQESR